MECNEKRFYCWGEIATRKSYLHLTSKIKSYRNIYVLIWMVFERNHIYL